MTDKTPPTGPGKPDHQRSGPAKVAKLNTEPDQVRAELSKHFARVERLLPEMTAHFGMKAKHRRIQYNAYLSEGFSAEQAMELLMAEIAAGKV